MTTQERKAVGHRLRQQRNRLGLTREQFAELADIGAGYYGQLHPAGTASGRKSSAAIFATRRYLVLFLRPLLEYNKKAAMLGT